MEAKKAAIEDWFRGGAGVCKMPIDKVSLDPESKYMFLDINRMVDMGERLKAIGGKLIPLEEFLENLFSGEYHIDTIEELGNVLDKTKSQRDKLEVKMRMDLTLIEEDMNKLCGKITSRIEEYFAELSDRLKQIHIENHIESGMKLEKFERLLEKKIDYKRNLGSGSDGFDLKTFYNKFKMMQKEPDKLEKHFQGMLKRKYRYDAFREDRELKQFQNIFREESSFEENIISYLENKHKLERIINPLPVSSLGRPTTAEDKFVENVVELIDKTIGIVRHFEIKIPEKNESGEGQNDQGLSRSKIIPTFTTSIIESSLKTPLTAVNRSTSVERENKSLSPQKETSFLDSPAKSALKENSLEKTQDGISIPIQNDRNDNSCYLKGSRAIKDGLGKDRNLLATVAGFELIGHDWTKTSFDDAIAYLEELNKVEDLMITIAEVASIGRGRMRILNETISSKYKLKHLDICLARSKLNKQDIEEIQILVENMPQLESFTLNIDGYV